MTFSNPIVGGSTLIRPAIHSPDYVAGSTGWSINKDGTAEFNDVTIRGSVGIGGESFYYDPSPGVGNLVASIAANTGLDPFGNAHLSGFTSYDPDQGSHISMSSGIGAYLDYKPQNVTGVDYLTGSLGSTIGASNRGGVQMTSPATSANSRRATYSMFGGGPTTNDTSILFSADRVNFSDDVEVTDSLTAGNMEWGTVQTPAPGVGGGTSSAAVTFSKTFPTTPRVFTQISSAADPGVTTIRAYVLNETSTGFDVSCFRSSDFPTNIRWWAVSD